MRYLYTHHTHVLNDLNVNHLVINTWKNVTGPVIGTRFHGPEGLRLVLGFLAQLIHLKKPQCAINVIDMTLNRSQTIYVCMSSYLFKRLYITLAHTHIFNGQLAHQMVCCCLNFLLYAFEVFSGRSQWLLAHLGVHRLMTL